MDKVISGRFGEPHHRRKRETLSEIALLRLRRAIVTHELLPGEKISEASLVERFGLTKSAVRSALTRLSEDGLIAKPSPKTHIVAPLTMDEIRSVFHLRFLLEPDITRRAAGKIDPQALRELDAACRADYDVGDKIGEFALLEANRNFHCAVAWACGDGRHARWVEQLHNATMRILWVSLQLENRPDVWRHTHEEILNDLINGNGDAAAACCVSHIKEAQRIVYEVLTSSPSFQNLMILPPNE
ncbi:MAG: GntR family transcriptional regulator [Rhodospirillales bacterium]|jgi:DNA-binding GntR family transcriptional regulator|nr:GntR family transcriptional regulator [Rhodospirillales bacterium]|tara:strand:+ start:762 stop:1490 length:729 start_codon:yes stop_codon:yes gene_type:complete